MFFQRLRNVFSKTSKPFREGSGSQCGFTYDENGNMTCRLESGVTYLQTYNAENRIASIQKLASGTCTEPEPLTDKWDFTGACPEQRRRDGDGTRTGQLYTPYTDGDPGAAVTTRYFFGGAYETTGSAWKKYYSFGGTTLMRDADGFKYFLSDHLGSVSVVLDDAAAILEQQRYLPFGQARVMPPYASVTSTDLTYTGQRSIAGTGLMDYNARFYSPYITHFTQPDTIVPDPYNPQSLNRYSYVRNNPIRYNDPTGHKECEEINCNSGVDAATSIERDLQKTYDIQFKGRWRQKELIYLRHALKKVADSAGGADNLNDIFADAMSKSKHPTEKITFESRVGKCNGGHACWIPESGKVIFNHKIFTSEYQSAPGTWRPAELGLSNNTDAGVEITIIHEIVHVFATARPTATGIYQARIPNTDKDNAEERMANTTAFYIVSGMHDWPGRPYHFQVIRSMNSLWKATP